jgi:hypothetical protein
MTSRISIVFRVGGHRQGRQAASVLRDRGNTVDVPR